MPRARARLKPKEGFRYLNIPRTGEYSRFNETLSVWITPDSIRMNFSCGAPGSNFVLLRISAEAKLLAERKQLEAIAVFEKFALVRTSVIMFRDFLPTKTAANLEIECDTTTPSDCNSVL